MPRNRQPEPGDWQFTLGEPPLRLTAYERADRGLAIYCRRWTGRKYVDRRRFRDPIRTPDGAIDPAAETAVRQELQALLDALKAPLKEEPEGDDSESDGTGPLTLGKGFRRVFNPKRGKYASKTKHVGDSKRYAEVILDTLGRDLEWPGLRPAHYRALWRTLAAAHSQTGAYGHRTAEKIVGLLQSATLWLQEEQMLEPGAGDPPRNWKAALKKEWVEITEAEVPDPQRPRYSLDESARLWAALPHADPRLQLGMEIGAELRLGQLPRSRRSDVLRHGVYEIGAVRVHGRGKKHVETVVLTPEQRMFLSRALHSGYLRDLEQAYQCGAIDDYYLLPGGRLLYWQKGVRLITPVAQMKNANRQLGDTGLRKQWGKLEKLAGVEHVDKRAWYGIRRLQTDRAEDVESDARVLNRLGAWKNTSTRERYQEEGRVEIADRTAAARRKIRPGKDLPEQVDPE